MYMLQSLFLVDAQQRSYQSLDLRRELLTPRHHLLEALQDHRLCESRFDIARLLLSM